MALIGKNTNLNVKVAGNEVVNPRNLLDIEVLASFEDGNPSANITFEELTFELEAYTAIKEHIANGLISGVGITEGIPIIIEASNIDQGFSIFDGYIDLLENAVIDDITGKVFAKIKKKEGLNNLSDRLNSISYRQLFDEGIIKESDFQNVNYVVESNTSFAESILLRVTLLLLAKATFEATKDAANAIATVTGITASGVTGAVGGGVFAAANAIVLTAYALALLRELIGTGRDVFRALLPPLRTHKCTSFKKLLEKACEKLGYGFNTSISYLDEIYYLPSNPNVDTSFVSAFVGQLKSITIGLPNPEDFGNICGELFDLCRDMFNARYSLVNGVVQMHTEFNQFWKNQSSYILPDVLQPEFSYNADEIKSRFVVGFSIDQSDVWTIQDKTDRVYEVITSQKQTTNADFVGIKGFEQIQLPLALGSRKTTLSGFEQLVRDFARFFDTVTGIFGGGTNFASQITNKLGSLKVSDNNHRLPKVLYLNGKKLPSNHRELLSAKYLYNTFLNEKSFVSFPDRRQRKRFESYEVPFGFEAFLKTIENSYIYDKDNKPFKVEKITWFAAQDRAVLSGFFEERFTNNLKETFIEI